MLKKETSKKFFKRRVGCRGSGLVLRITTAFTSSCPDLVKPPFSMLWLYLPTGKVTYTSSTKTRILELPGISPFLTISS